MQDHARQLLGQREVLVVVNLVEIPRRSSVHDQLPCGRRLHERRQFGARSDIVKVGLRAHAAGLIRMTVLRCVAATSPRWLT